MHEQLRLRRVEPRQCKGTSCAVGWARTRRSVTLSYRFSCRRYLYVYKYRQFYKTQDSNLIKRNQVSEFEHSKSILQNHRAPTRRKEKACAHKLWNLQFAHCVCVSVPINVYVRWSTRARLSPLVAARAKCLFNSLILSVSAY